MAKKANPRPIALAAVAQYPIDATRVRLLHAGYNSTYRVDTPSGRLALRVTRAGPTRAHVLAEVAWMRAVAADTGLRVARPLAARDGTPVVSVDGRQCVLSTWVDGAQRSNSLSPRMLAAVGAALAILHQQGAAWQPPPGWQRPAFDGLWLSGPDPRPHLPPTVAALFDAAAGRVAPVLDRLRALPRHVIHGDLHQGNYRFAAGIDLGILDFDDCAIGHPAQDVAITLYYLQTHPRFDALWAALRAGYERLRPWPSDPATTRALMAWRVLHLYAELRVHPDPAVRALGESILPKWIGRLEAFLAATP